MRGLGCAGSQGCCFSPAGDPPRPSHGPLLVFSAEPLLCPQTPGRAVPGQRLGGSSRERGMPWKTPAKDMQEAGPGQKPCGLSQSWGLQPTRVYRKEFKQSGAQPCTEPAARAYLG